MGLSGLLPFGLDEADSQTEANQRWPQPSWWQSGTSRISRDQGHPPSIERFLTISFHLTSQLWYIFGNLRQNPIEWRWLQPSWLASGTPGTSRRSMASSKYKGVPDNYFLLDPPLYIFGNLRQNPVHWRWSHASRPSGTPGRTMMSSKYREVLDNHFSLNIPKIVHFQKPQAKYSCMKMTPTIMIPIRCLRDLKLRISSIVYGGSWQQFFT